MRYVEIHTSILVPHVHLAEFDVHNVVGTRFMLMDSIVGPSLDEVWDRLTPKGHEQAIRQLCGFQSELLKLEFPAIGSLLDEHGTLGPLSRSCMYPSLLGLDCGPFKTTKEYLLANVSAEPKLIQETPENWREQRKDLQNLSGGLDDTSLEDAHEWLRLLYEGVQGLRDDILDLPESPFVLFHDDFFSGRMWSFRLKIQPSWWEFWIGKVREWLLYGTTTA